MIFGYSVVSEQILHVIQIADGGTEKTFPLRELDKRKEDRSKYNEVRECLWKPE